MNIKSINMLKKPHDEENSSILKIISSRLKKLGRDKKNETEPNPIYWDSDFFSLNQSKAYYRLSVIDKNKMLILCNENLLLESYFIEKLGMAYCARMSLLAETVESSQLYSLIGADEATHLKWITPFIPSQKRTSPVGTFLEFLTELVQNGDPASLVFPLQIILEGWGIHHYQLLQHACLHAGLKNILQDIVKDEALHHHAGIALYQPEKLTQTQTNYMYDCLIRFIEMIRVGPLSVIQTMDEISGGLNKNEKIKLIDEISGTTKSIEKLMLIKKLMMISGNEKMLAYFDKLNLFQGYSAEQMVENSCV